MNARVTVETINWMREHESEGELEEGDSFSSLELRTISTITQGRKSGDFWRDDDNL